MNCIFVVEPFSVLARGPFFESGIDGTMRVLTRDDALLRICACGGTGGYATE